MNKPVTHIALAAAGAFLLTSAPASAKSAGGVVVTGQQDVLTATVTIADLNLASVAGRNTLAARVRGAVKQVCPSSGVMPLSDTLQLQDCTRTARSSAAAQIERVLAARG